MRTMRPAAAILCASFAIVATLMLCAEHDVQHDTVLIQQDKAINSGHVVRGTAHSDDAPEAIFLEEMPPMLSDDSSDGEGIGDVYPGGRQTMDAARTVVTGIHRETPAVDADDFDPMPPMVLPSPPPPPSLKVAPNTTAPTPVPTNATEMPIATPPPSTAAPTPTPTPAPTMPSCATCVSGFVANKGCDMWKANLDAKSALTDGCEIPESPLLSDPACERKLAEVCGMTKRPDDWGNPAPPLAPCNDEQKATLHSGIGGHLGCVSAGGACMVNVNIPQCVCKPGFSGRACDVGPGADKNVSVPSSLLIAADMAKGTSCANNKANHDVIKSEVSESFIAKGESREITLTYGKAAHVGSFGKHSGGYAVLSVDEGTTAWLEQFQFVEAFIGPKKHRVHLGFWRAVGPLLSDLADKIEANVDKKNKELFIAGYGQAGAMANILALYMSEARGLKVSLVTLAAPRVGDFAFAQALTASLHKVERVVRSGDPFIVVPTQSCLDYYRCLGGEVPYVHYVHAGVQITLPAWGKDPTLCTHPTFHHEGVNGGMGHLHKLAEGPHANTCLSKHDLKGYVEDLAKQVVGGEKYVCTSGTFKPLPPPPAPPPVVITNVPLQHPPSLKDWGPSDASNPWA